jgi:hypothetical protein
MRKEGAGPHAGSNGRGVPYREGEEPEPMKNTDVIPSDRTPRKLELPEVWLFRYTPKLQDELEKGIITREEALRLYRALILTRNLEYMVRDLDVKRFGPHEGYEYRGTCTSAWAGGLAVGASVLAARTTSRARTVATGIA